jgi:hypothetical protein
MLFEFIENLKTFGLEMLGLFYAGYPAKVKDNTDDSFSGRIRIFIDSLMKKFFTEEERKFFAKLGFATEEKQNVILANALSPYAGHNYGFYFPPEKDKVDDKEPNVVVIFPTGRGGRPMYLGSWWYEGSVPVEFRNPDGTVTKRGIKTKSGHIILFEDSDAGNNVKRTEIKSSSGHKVVLNDKEKKIDISSQGGLFIEIDDNDNKIVISAKGTSITLDGKSGKIYLHKSDAVQNYVRGLELLSDLAGHVHMGVHGQTSPPINSPRVSILSQDIFGE